MGPSPNVAGATTGSIETASSLRLTGRATGIEVADAGDDYVRVQISLNLTIRNAGERPVLMYSRDPLVVERRILASPSDVTERRDLFHLATYPSIGRNRTWETIQAKLDASEPPSDLIRRLDPGDSFTWTYVDWFNVRTTNHPGVRDLLRERDRPSPPVWLQVTIEMWPKDIELNENRDSLKFSRAAQRRWTKAGDLELDDLESELIRLDFTK